MTSSRFTTLADAVEDAAFPDVDLALRRGRHIHRDEGEHYLFLRDAQAVLEPFYRRYDCELVERSDGYFYLLPSGDRLGRRHLSAGEMLVGQALTLLFLDPATVRDGGVVTRDQVLGHMASAVGPQALMRAFHPTKKRYDERVAAEAVRTRVSEALRRLATLGFVDVGDEGRVRLHASLLRFADPVRGDASPEVELARLVAAGELIVDPATEGAPAAEDAEIEADADAAEDASGSPHDAPSARELPAARDDDYGDAAGDDEPTSTP